MQGRVKWVEGLTFLGESASGHQILMDGNSGDKAPSPMEMVLMAAVVLPLPHGVLMTLSLPRTKEDVSSTSDRYLEFFISGYSPGS